MYEKCMYQLQAIEHSFCVCVCVCLCICIAVEANADIDYVKTFRKDHFVKMCRKVFDF